MKAPTVRNRALLATLGALFSGTTLPPVSRIRRGETAGAARRDVPQAIQLQRIERAAAKRARKAAIRLKVSR